MKLNRIMIAAPKSGSGKTMLMCALLQALKDRGMKVFSYKCGPDYIDPMFHQRVIGIPSKNLDTFFSGAEETRGLLLKDRKDGEFAVLEGVMGLFDGLGGTREEGSSYHLASVTKTPIVLVVDAKGMGRSVIPLLAGFLAYDREKLIQGVILNRMSKGYYEIIRPLIEEELSVQVLGYFQENRELCIESRHLGLKMPQEMQHMKEKLQIMSEELEKTADVDKILQIASAAENIAYTRSGVHKLTKEEETEMPVIAVAKDDAFCFYYEDNIRLLEEYGTKIEYFSPLYDKALPEKCAGLLIGGGYPELYASQLSRNTEMRKSIRKAIEEGMPSVAECGGFMYLHEELENESGLFAMAGVIPGRCHNTGKLVRFGYIEIEEKRTSFLEPEGKIRGHEFHYYDSTDNGSDCQAVKPVSGKRYSCVMAGNNHWWGFPHLYYPSNPQFAKNFVNKARAFMTAAQRLPVWERYGD
ncbi:MAG: cobyrinate a,c-diamide synthase [Lachnospiraceae bacterium]|nr:cobyrinate a,c-diamide synthase [Lachnospiraceae bacterium]